MADYGYACPVCQQWIYPNMQHYCGAIPPNPLGAQPVNPCLCRAPFVPLTPEMVRLIVREELERAAEPPEEKESEHANR